MELNHAIHLTFSVMIGAGGRPRTATRHRVTGPGEHRHATDIDVQSGLPTRTGRMVCD